MQQQDQYWLARLRAGDTQVLGEIYQTYRGEFLGWLAKTYACPREEATELYQVVILILDDNVRTGKLEQLQSSLKTYLYAIARNKWLEGRRLQGRANEQLRQYLYNHAEGLDPHERRQREARLDALAAGLDQLGDPCRKLLELFYYHQLSMEEITGRMGYHNADTTKNVKYKCLQRLRKLLTNQPGL